MPTARALTSLHTYGDEIAHGKKQLKEAAKIKTPGDQPFEIRHQSFKESINGAMSIKSGLETVEELAKIKSTVNCSSSRFKLADWGMSPQFLEHRKENFQK